ncbi:MAG TPA: thiolase family protein [Acidimicrobiia bacterium]|nr:thiolase family protein [Acidimicrobiia bacterium]
MNDERVAIVGVGYSTVGRSTGLTLNELMTQAAVAAMDDAGIRPDDVDGLSTMGGFAIANAWMLGITPLDWFLDAELGPAFLYPAVHSIAAIQAGLCHTCIVIRLIQRTPASVTMPPAMDGNRDPGQFTVPFGSIAPTHWAGLMTRRHMIEYGTTEEQFAAHAVAQREHARRNDDALVRDPLTIDDYLAARYVSKPVRILDCDYPCDAGSAVIFTTEARARDCRKPPVFVDSYAMSAVYDGFETLPDMTRTAPTQCARTLWSRSSLRPTDVDCAHLYDGFTIITFQWLEALGLCRPGESGPFVACGHTRLGGRVPVNTDGGACNVGRRHGANFCIEATRQLRGECGARQVPGAEVAVVTNGVGPFAAAALLTGS